MPTSEEATRLFEQRRDAWLREDLDAYLALWTEDMTFWSPVHAEPLRGRAAFADLVVKAVRAARLEARTTVQSFDWRTLVEVKTRASGALVPGYHAVDRRKRRVVRSSPKRLPDLMKRH